jgi:hypothetical protein
MLDAVTLQERVDPHTGEQIFDWVDVFPPIEDLHENCAVALAGLRRISEIARNLIGPRPPPKPPILSNFPDDLAWSTRDATVDDEPYVPPEPPAAQERGELASQLNVSAAFFARLDGISTNVADDSANESDDAAWLRVGAVARVFGIPVAEVTRAANAGRLKCRGRHKKRRIEAASIYPFLLKRQQRAEQLSAKQETDADVERKFRDTGGESRSR